MIEKIAKSILEFYGKFVEPYASAYFSWLSERLSGTNPFAMISISIVLIFVLAVYMWVRNSDS
jgi:hypothetical protein